MNGKQLKNSILQLAIQGKLVPQDPKDESASVLLESIRKEKERLFKESKLKKKDLVSTPITEEEKPFEIPKTWEWVRLGELVYNQGQKKPDKKFSYIDIGSIDNKKQCLNVEENIIDPSNAPSRARKIVQFGDVIYSTVRPYLHNMAIIDKYFLEEPIASTGFAVFTTIQLYNKYLFFYLMSPQFDEYANDGNNAKGIAYPAINDDKLYKSLIPLPPLAEQHRIVEKIEELMPLIEEYDNAQKQLDRLNADLPEALKKSILQEAIQGKLVPQDPKDEPASVLLESIRKEKERLFKESKLKKKDLVSTPITEEEKPFEIPQTWKWVRLGEVFSHSNGKQLNRADTQGKYNDYITTSNLYWDRFDLKNIRQMRFTSDELIRYTATKGDLLICEGGDVGRSAIWDKNYNICIQNHIHRARAYYPLCTRFFLYIFMFNKSVGLIGGKGIGIQGLSAKVLHNILLPLPPLAEQHRIVEKIEELFAKLK